MARDLPRGNSGMTLHRLPSLVRTRVIAANGRGDLERVEWLTPYMAETIGQAAHRAGPGSRLEVVVPHGTAVTDLAAVEMLFRWLVEKGVSVSVRRDENED